MSNFSDPDTSLKDVIFNTPYYPSASFVPIANNPKLSAKRHFIWMKDRVYGESDVQDVMLQCQTIQIPETVKLGTFESKVNKCIIE